MTEPHDVGPERLGALIDGAPPAGEAEGALVALMGDLRTLEDGAPEGLRARVRDELARAGTGVGEVPEVTGRRHALDPRRWLGDRGERRRRLLVAAPVAAALVAAALLAVPALDDDDAPRGDGPAAVAPRDPAAGPAPVEAAPRAASPADAAGPPVGDPARLTAVDAAVSVRVEDPEALARAAAAATRSVEDAGGERAGRGARPGGGDDPAVLVFRVPPGSVEVALEGFSRLGTMTGQTVDAEDVTASVRAAQTGLAGLRRRSAALRARAAADPGDAELAARAERAEAATERAEASLAALRERARRATVTLTLTIG